MDAGGGELREGESVLREYPYSTPVGKFVVEDLPFVINDITERDPRIEQLFHDFTTPQPIRLRTSSLESAYKCSGARAYFLQNVLHNWAEPVCKTILQRPELLQVANWQHHHTR